MARGKCPRAGVRVKHSSGDTGVVTPIQLPSGKTATCVGKGKQALVYVKWDAGGMLGVPRRSVRATASKKSNALGEVFRVTTKSGAAPPFEVGRVIGVAPGDYLDAQGEVGLTRTKYENANQLINELEPKWVDAMRDELQRKQAMRANPQDQGKFFGLGSDRPAVNEQRGDQWSIRSSANYSLFSAWGLKPMGPKAPPSPYADWGVAEGSPLTWGLTFEMRRPGEITVLGQSNRGPDWGISTYFTGSTRVNGNLTVSTPADIVQAVATEGLFTLRGLFWQGQSEPEMVLTTSFSREQREALLVWLDTVTSKGTLSGLGSTDSEHATEFENARHELISAVSDAETALHNGQCRAANVMLDEAHVQYGRLRAEAMGAKSMSEAVDLHKMLRSVEEPFDQKCIRSEPVSETYEKSMRAMRPGLAGFGNVDQIRLTAITGLRQKYAVAARYAPPRFNSSPPGGSVDFAWTSPVLGAHTIRATASIADVIADLAKGSTLIMTVREFNGAPHQQEYKMKLDRKSVQALQVALDAWQSLGFKGLGSMTTPYPTRSENVSLGGVQVRVRQRRSKR